MDETVAIKILNPVGFRILPPEALDAAVVVKEGDEHIAERRCQGHDRHARQARVVGWSIPIPATYKLCNGTIRNERKAR